MMRRRRGRAGFRRRRGGRGFARMARKRRRGSRRGVRPMRIGFRF